MYLLVELDWGGWWRMCKSWCWEWFKMNRVNWWLLILLSFGKGMIKKINGIRKEIGKGMYDGMESGGGEAGIRNKDKKRKDRMDGIIGKIL